MNDTLSIKTKIQVLKPSDEVYEAIVNPDKMSNYFISSGSGRMEAGKALDWYFPEFPDKCPVRVKEANPNSFISFYWGGEDAEKLVEITLESVHGNATTVTITEKEAENNEEGIKWLMGNTEGWANFLACLKAFLEYGINLRKGAFDFIKQ